MHWSCAGLLLQAGARTDIVNGEGKTCLQVIPYATERDAHEFANYLQQQQYAYACENSCKADLFEFALPAPPPLPLPASFAGVAATPAAKPGQGPATSAASVAVACAKRLEHESIRRLCWAIEHLHREAAPFAGTSRPADPAASAQAQAEALDPDLLAPIQALEWSFGGGGGGLSGSASTQSGASPASAAFGGSPFSPAVVVPHHSRHYSTASTFSASSQHSASTVPTLSSEAKAQLRSSLLSLQQLAMRFPPSPLGPGLESRHRGAENDPPIDPSEPWGPRLSWHGLGHFVNHVATHWPGLPLSYKKFCLSYLIRFASHPANAAAMVGSTRPVDLCWANDRSASQSVLARLVDAVLDWVEIQRGLSSSEPECSLLPPSKTFCSVATALGSLFPAQANPLTNPHNAGTAALAAALAASHTMQRSHRRSPSAQSSAAAAMASTFGAAFSGLLSPSAPSVGGSPAATRGSASHLGPPSSAQAPGTPSAQAQSNPFVPPFSYVDDYEVASLLLELVASVLCTLRTHAAQLRPEMASGPASEANHAAAVAAEECAANGLPKVYVTGGGGGCGQLAAIVHPSVAACGHAAKEGVFDEAVAAAMQEHENNMEARIARRATVNAGPPTSAFETRGGEGVAGNLTAPPADEAAAGASPRGAVAVHADLVRLWRNVVRLFEEGSSSSVLRLGSIMLRAPFPSMVHPLLSLRTVFMWREGFAAMALWHPKVCDAFRTQEVIGHTLRCTKNVQHLLRPLRMDPSILGTVPKRDPQAWKRTFNVDLAKVFGIEEPEGTANLAIQISPEEETKPATTTTDPATGTDEAAAPAASSTSGRPSRLLIASNTAPEDDSPIKVLPVDQEAPTKLSAGPETAVAAAPTKSLHSAPPSLTSPARLLLPLVTAEEKEAEAAGTVVGNTTPRAQKWVARTAGSVPALSLPSADSEGTPLQLKQQPPQPSQGPDTTRELQLVLGMRGADRMGAAGAGAMVSKLTAYDEAHPPPPPPPKGPKEPYMPALRTVLPERPPADFPQSPRHSLRTSASVTALELASPLIQGAAKSIGVVAAPVKSSRGKMAHTLLPVIPRFRRSVGSKLRDVTTSQMGRVKLSMKEAVIVELAKERVAAERAEALRKQQEEDSVVRIADPSKQIMALAQADSFGMLDVAEQQQPAVPNAGPQNSTSLLATALPDFYSAFTIAARMMLVDRCSEFLLLLILDSAKRAQALVVRKRAVQQAKAQREADEQKRKDDAAALRGDVDLIPLGPPAAAKRPEQLELTHDSTNHRTLKGLNDAYGPPPLTTLAADLMNFGVIDHLLMMLSERNQSLSVHRNRHAGSAPTNSEGVRLIYPEDENISVHAGLQCLAYLLRMDSTVEMMMHSAHALVVVEHLAATSEEGTASSCLYILSHLLRKRDWNKRLLALKGLNPHAFKTEAETNDEEDAVDDNLAANRHAADAVRRDQEMGISDASGGGEHDGLKLYVPLEYLLMTWARVALQLSLQCLPLKPWSTLPRSLLLRNIPTRPSEAPMKLLVYQPLSEEQTKEIDRQRAQDEAAARYKDSVARMIRAEEEREAQEIADRTFLTSLGYSADLVAARPKLALPPPPQESTSLALMSPEQLRELGLGPVTARDALESSAIPPAQSWFAQHYTPPTLEQRQYVEALAKAQESKIKAKSHHRNQLSVSDAQTHATLAAAGMAPPFTPIAAFDGSARMEAHAESLYRNSGVHRIGGQGGSTRMSLSASVDSADPNALVVAAILSGASTPANKARTVYAINTAAATAASPNRTAEELEASHRTDVVLSPTSRSLQRRIDALSARSSAQSSPMSKQYSRRLTTNSVVPALALDGILSASQDNGGARTVKFDFDGGAEATSARLLKDSTASSMRTTRSSPTGSPSLDGQRPEASSDEDEDGALGMDGMLQEDPTVRAMHLAAKATARAERKAAQARTEEARQKVRNSSSPPTRRSHRSTPSDAPFEPASAAAQSAAAANTSQPTSVIGGSTPSWADIALSESLLYRILHCFMGFTRREEDARKVLHSGALDLLVGLVNHPVWDISYHALQVLTMLSTRFSEEYLVAFMEVLTRKHLSPGWLGVSLESGGPWRAGMTHKPDALGFPWPTLESLVCSCADFLRVDVTFRPGSRTKGSQDSKEPSNTARRFPVGGSDSSALLSPPVAAPPTRDLRSALAFQLLLNLCQDPKGRGYAMVQRQCLWYENLLADVLSHPSLKDLEERQKRFQKITHHFGSAVAGVSANGENGGATSFYRFPMQQNFGGDDAPAAMAKMQQRAASEKQLAQQRRAHAMSSPSSSSSAASLGRPATPSSPARSTSPHSPHRQSSNQVLLAAQRSKSSALLHAAAVGRPRTPGSSGGRPSTALSPHRRSATQPASMVASSGFVSGGKSATGPDSSLVAATRLLVLSPEEQALQSPVVPVRPFGHWNPTGGLVFDRYYPGGVGFPAYASGSGVGAVGGGSEASPASKVGLDFELDPSAAVAGSTELMELVAGSQLSTQPVGLRVCGLASCSGVEHVAGTFLVCPRCRLSSYCCDEHRRLAWRSWHERVCCVTKRPVMKPNQTVRYPVKPQRRLHSGIPRGLRLELLGERKEEQPITRIV